MSMKMTKYITPLLAGTAAAVAIAAARRRSQQIISPATGAAREPSASLAATFRSPPQVQFHPYGDQTLLLFHH